MAKLKLQLKYLYVKTVAQSHHNKTGVMNINVMLKPHDDGFKFESAVYLFQRNTCNVLLTLDQANHKFCLYTC